MDWLSFSRNNQEMVDKFTRLGIIESSEVERAFRCVSRAAFVPDDLMDDAFKDTPLRGSHHVHLSAPHMYAAILEELELDSGMAFLNVGSGTGYFSTLAGYIIKKDGINHGIELHEDLVSFANEKVTKFLENGPADSKDICSPVFVCGNACRLDPDQMKYDRLYCGAACSQSNVKFLLKMVKVGGFLIAPVGFRLIKLKRVSLKEGRQSVINDVSFAPLVAVSPEEMKLPKLRFPENFDKKNKKSSIICDVSFPVCKSPGRKSLAKLRAFQDAMECLQNGKQLPMPYCYVPCFEDLGKSRSKSRRLKDRSSTTSTLHHEASSFGDSGHAPVDSQIDFFAKTSDSLLSSGMELTRDAPEAESTRQSDTSTSAKRKPAHFDWERLSTDKTWIEVLEHYYSLCATTEARKQECTNIKVEKYEEQLTFRKYAKQMGLIPSRVRKKSIKSDAKGDAPVVEEVANDIVENLLEEVISQVDENDLAEDFLAAVTGTGPYANEDIRRRSSVARAIILDNLPRLRALAGDSGGLSETLQGLIRNIDAAEENTRGHSENSCDDSQESCEKDKASRDASMLNMHTFVNNIIADIDKQILHDIANDKDIENCLEMDEIPPLESSYRRDNSKLHTNSADEIPFSNHSRSSSGTESRNRGCVFDDSYPNKFCFGVDNEGTDDENIKKNEEMRNKDFLSHDGCVPPHSNFNIPPINGEVSSLNNLNSDIIFVRKQESGHFASIDDTAESERLSPADQKQLLSSFHSDDHKRWPKSDRLTLLEQKNAYMLQKGIVSVKLDGGIPSVCSAPSPASEIHENPFRSSSLCHDTCDGDVSSSDVSSCCCNKFQLKFCLEKSSESTPNAFSAPGRNISSCNLKFSDESLNCSCCSSAFDEKRTRTDYSLDSNHEQRFVTFNTFSSDGTSSSCELPNSVDSQTGSFDSRSSMAAKPVKHTEGLLEGNSLDTTNSLSCTNEIPDGSSRRIAFESNEFRGASSGIMLCQHQGSDMMKTTCTGTQHQDCHFGNIDLVKTTLHSASNGTNQSRHHTSISDIDPNGSLIASTPLHKRYSPNNEVCNISPDDAASMDSITPGDPTSSDEIPMANNGAVDDKDLKSVVDENAVDTVAENPKGVNSPFITSYTPSFKKKRKQKRVFTNIKMDVASSKMLRSSPGKDWGLQHDKELVLYLTRKDKTSSHVAFGNCCASTINPKCFASTDLIQYKRICSYPADALAKRGIALRRLADVLDSIMNVLVGPSLNRDQFKTPTEKDYPLKSFNETSFESSGMPFEFKQEEDEGREEGRAQDFDKGNETTADMVEGKNPGKYLVETMQNMMSQELENVRNQKELVCAKLNLYDSLNAEYDEQLRLIKEQVGLVEEQQQLLQARLRAKFAEENWSQTLVQTEQMILERKMHRKQLSEQVEAIKLQREEKIAEHESLLEIHRQLTSLEKGLVEERNSSLKMGLRYLENGEGKLDRFAKCVKKSNEIVNQLTAMNEGLAKDSPLNTLVDDSSEEVLENEKKNADSQKYRYHPHLLLSKSRFLFPLTSKRLNIIKELLRMSETDSLQPNAVARVDRRVPLKERHKYPSSNTVFMQTYNALKHKDVNFRDIKRNFEKLWEVKFIGEGIIDQGGGFRDSLAEIADELCPASAEIKECLNLFIKTPNQQSGTGDHRDSYIPNPSCSDFHLYSWIGKLIGAAFRTDETLPLAFPPFIWKLLIGESVSWSNDFVGVDQGIVRMTDGIELLDEETYERLYKPDQYFIVHLSDGTARELVENGSQIPVNSEDRSKYARLLRKTRMQECAEQVKAMQDGLVTVVPDALLSCLTWQDFERGVCGSPEITVNDLKANCRYELDLSPTDDCVAFLWEALASFSSEERSRFIRFVTGRKRLPSPFFVSKSLTKEDSLPTASTCGCNLFLPSYTNAKVAAEKIRYAVNNCISIDTDTSPW